MKKIITLLLLAFLTFQNFTSKAQIDTVFWFATPFISPDNTPRDNYILHVYAYGTPATVRLRQPAAIAPNKYDTIFTVPANTMFDYIFWRDKLATTTNRGFDSLEVQPSDVVLPYGLWISSTTTISAVFDIATRSPLFSNPETFSLKGQHALGLEFLCPFQTKGNNQTLMDLAGTQPGIIQPKQQINIVATKANTTVSITPKCNVIGHPANITYTILLPNPGSAYTAENTVQTTTVSLMNLTGTSILADKPIAVTVADDAVKGVTGCYDLAGDQMVPIDEIGTEYIVLKGLLGPSENDGVYIVGAYNNTQVTINDGVTTTTVINKGDTYFYKTTQSVTSIIASNDVYAMHLTGNGCEVGEGLIPPLGCSGSSLAAFSKNNPQAFFINLYCKNGAQGAFTLNNNTASVNVPITASNFTVVPGTSTLSGGPYYAAQLIMSSTALLPLGSYTINNSVDVFGMGVFNGGSTSGSNYHYMTEFAKNASVSAGTISALCIGSGNTVSLSGNVSGSANTGTWSTANGTGFFGSYTSTLNTVSTVYTLSNNDTLLSSIKFYMTSIGGCHTTKDSINVQIIQRPQITTGSGTTICNNSTNPIVLTGTVLNALGANWSGGTGFFAPGVNITYTPTAADHGAGTLSLTLSSFGGCSALAKSIVFTFVPSPTVIANTNSSLICVGETATLSASGANTYSWNTSSTNTSIAVSPTGNTIYTVTGTLANGCSNTATITQNVSLCTGINNNGMENMLSIYPNPSTGEFMINTINDVKLTLVNELGQQIKILILNEANSRKVSVTGLSAGVYFITGKVNDRLINQKIIVTK